MKQVQMTEFGPPEVLKLVERPIPSPRAGEIVARVEAIGVNFSDILRRKNAYFMPTPLPFVPGAEAVGRISAAGEGVTIPEGARILAILPDGGGYADHVVADARFCVPLPPDMDPVQATALFVQGTTAYLLANRTAGDLRGRSVLVHAAAGGVGSLLVQAARLSGASVIAAGSSPAKLRLAGKLGAVGSVDYSREGWPQEVIRMNGGRKVDAVFDAVGGRIYEESFACLRTGGTMVVYGSASAERGLMHSEHFVNDGHHLSSFNLAYFIQEHQADWQEALGAMIRLLSEGSIRVSTQTYPLEKASQAHRDIEARKTSGKVVLTL